MTEPAVLASAAPAPAPAPALATEPAIGQENQSIVSDAALATQQEINPEELRSLLQVVSPSEVVEFMNLFLYAESGVGKTFFTGTADDDPRLRPLLIFDVEGGVTTLRDKPGIDVVSCRSLKALEDNYNRLYHSIRGGKLYYKTVGIDSVTELADLDMRVVMKQAYQKNPETVDIDVPSPREWGKVRNHIRLIVRAFRDLPCHVVFTGSLGVIQEEGRAPKYVPGFAGKLQREVPGFADIVGYYYQKNEQGVINRYLQVQGTDRVIAKDRTKVLGGIVMNPTLGTIWDSVEGVSLEPEQQQEEM